VLLLWIFSWPPFEHHHTLEATIKVLNYSQNADLRKEQSQIVGPIKTLDSKSLGMIFNESDRLKKEEGFKAHAFNVLISERIGLLRELPDTRNELCHNLQYDLESFSKLDTSVVVCFYNEDFNTLQRTIYTVLERTPSQLLKELILIDDHSDS